MKTLKILILFIIVLSGCSEKYLDSREEDLIDREILASWKTLNGEVFKQDNEGFSLNIWVGSFVSVGSYRELEEVYKRDSHVNTSNFVRLLLGAAIGFGGCVVGYNRMESNNCMVDGIDKIEEGCMISGASSVIGLVLVSDMLFKSSQNAHVLTDFISIDTVCTDSTYLSIIEIETIIEESNFKKTYYTDENGIIQLKFDEFIPETTEADSVLNLIIQYEDLADSVKVRRF